jgi:hypothetical protein
MSVGTRWVLAFDASCETCREISIRVSQASDGKLEVLPLSHPDVQQWREQGLGAQPPWAPTLLKVQGVDVCAWMGAAMSIPLARRLGPRATLRVLQSLGQLRRQATGHPLEPESRNGIGYTQFLHLGAGAAVLVGMILASQMPALGPAARSWVKANKDLLPQDYDGLIQYPMPYRRAIYPQLSPTTQSQIWVEHLNRYRASHPGLSIEQLKVIEDATALASTLSTFNESRQDKQVLQGLKEATVAAFGENGAIMLIATIGPPDHPVTTPPDHPVTTEVDPTQRGGGCTCNKEDNYCGFGYHCRDGDCNTSSSGCGTFYGQQCNGLCFD